MSTLRIEPLAARHIPAILDIENEANGAPWSERSFTNELDNPQSIFAVGFSGSVLAAYGGVWMCVDEAHITNVAVRADLRQRGFGRQMVKYLMHGAKEQGMTCATLEVRASNVAAIALYENLGFAQVGLRKRYYPNNREDAIVMWLYELQQWQ